MRRDIYQIPSTHNNLFYTKYLNSIINNLNKTFDYKEYNYCNNKDYYTYISKLFCQKKKNIYYNWSSDFIIKDIFTNLTGSIWFEEPNYGMLNVYTNIFKLQKTEIQKAKNLYITFPNINTPFSKFSNLNLLKKFIKKNKKKMIIIDFAYYNNLFSIFDICKILKKLQKIKKDLLFIFSFTKLTGNANIRQGILITKHKILKKIINLSNPHRINNHLKYIITHLNKKILENHRLKLLKKRNKKINKLSPKYYFGFNLFFKKEKGKYIEKIKLYRYSI